MNQSTGRTQPTMNTYRVESLEKFVVRTVYVVDADSPQQAEQICKDGKVAWIETISVEPDDETRNETIKN